MVKKRYYGNEDLDLDSISVQDHIKVQDYYKTNLHSVTTRF